jgi:tRNA (guanine-N7-)-methyltransferase
MIDIDLNAVAIPLDWAELFGREAATDVEIGSGKGRFLLALAASRPERNLLAVERAGNYHRLCSERAAKRGLSNIRLLRTTAEDLLYRLLAPSSIDTLFILFPDPWPKKRHHKRRLITPGAVSAMAAMLRPGGQLLIKTDHAGYAAVIAEVLAGEPHLHAIDAVQAFADLPLSGFELKYLDQGRELAAFACERN